MEKSNSIITYLVGLLMMWFSRHTVQDIAFMVGAFVAVVTLVINVANFFINWHYRRKTFELQRRNVQGATLESDG